MSKLDELKEKRTLAVTQSIEIIEQTVKVEEPKKTKHSWIGTILLFIVIGIGIFLMFQISNELGDNSIPFAEAIKKINIDYLLLSISIVLFFVGLVIFEFSITLKIVTDKFNLLLATRVALIGKFYDYVTPMASGGQPMEIYEIHKKGYSGGVSTAVALARWCIHIFSWLLITMIYLIIGKDYLVSSFESGAAITTILILTWLGWGVTIILPITLILFLIMPKLALKLARFGISIGAYFKFIKDEDRTYNKVVCTLNELRNCFITITKRPFYFVTLILISLLEVVVLYTVPYFAILVFNSDQGFNFNELIKISLLNSYATCSAAIIPTPGNSGALESTASLIFKGVGGGILSWVILLYRFLTYYIFLLVGIIVNIVKFIKSLFKKKEI